MPNKDLEMNRKTKKLVWTDEMVMVIKNNYLKLSPVGITDLINKMFGTNKTVNSVQKKGYLFGFKFNNKLPDSL